MYQGPNVLTSPRDTAADGPGRRPGAVRSRRAPRATVNAPADSPWSWKPVRCPGSQLSSHTSWSSPQVSRWYQRRLRSYRTRLSPLVLARGQVLDQLPQPDLAQRRPGGADTYPFNQSFL